MKQNVIRVVLVGVLTVSPMASSPSVAGTVFGNGGASEITQLANNVQLGVANVELGIQNGISAVHAEIAAVQTAIMGNQYVKQVLQYAKMVEDTIIRYKQLSTMIQNLVKTVKNVVTAPRRWAQMVKSGFTNNRGLILTKDSANNVIRTHYSSLRPAPATPIAGTAVATTDNRGALKPVGERPGYEALLRKEKDAQFALLEMNGALMGQMPERTKRVEDLADLSNEANGAAKLQGEANKISLEVMQELQLMRWQQIVASNANVASEAIKKGYEQDAMYKKRIWYREPDPITDVASMKRAICDRRGAVVTPAYANGCP